MAVVHDTPRFAWCLRIKQTPTEIHAGTTDLDEVAAATTLGHVYTKRIKSIDETQLHQELSDMFYGIDIADAATFVLDNSDNAFDQSLEWRLVPVELYHYDRQSDVKLTDFQGLITHADFIGTEAHLTVSSQNAALFDELIPMTVVDPVVGGPFETSGAPTVPIPVVFGEHVPVKPVSISSNLNSDPLGADYAVGFGTLNIEGLFGDISREVADLERYAEWTTAPGTPGYVSPTRFSVSDNQQQRYYAGTPVRFKTSATGAAFIYTAVLSYDDTTTPDEVVLAHPVADGGLNTVEIGADFLVIYDGYDNITTGLLPVPAFPGEQITAVRLFAQEDTALLAFASNVDWPTSTVHVADIIKEILINSIWGLSVHTAQTVNTGTFAAANLILGLAGLLGAISGALAYDQQQRRAGGVLNELLMMRGGRLGQDGTGAHTLHFDSEPPAASKFFRLGLGDTPAIKVKRFTAHGNQPLEQAVRNVVLHWAPVGRSSFGNQRFTPREYERTATAPCTGIGVDRHYFNPWISTQDIAEKVAYYIAQKLIGADETLEFVAGVEARDVTLGEAITVQSVTDGITGDWQVYSLTKTLSEITIACFKVNPDAYITPPPVSPDPRAVVHSEVPFKPDLRTTPGSGSNLLPNPDFSPPPITPSFPVPHGWGIIPPPAATDLSTGSASYSAGAMDYSAQTLPFLIGGHAYRHTLTGTTAVPHLGGDGIFSDPFPVLGNSAVMMSIYVNHSDGVYFVIEEIPTSGPHTVKFVPVTYDGTDVNGLGYGRFYGRTTIKNTTKRVCWAICSNKDGTYEYDAADFRIVGRSARKPPAWQRGRPLPQLLTASDEITFNGSATYSSPNLIPFGAYVRGVTMRVTQAITLGTASGYDIGISANPSAWGDNITKVLLNETTDSRDFTISNSTFFATATSITVQGHAAGTITSGKLRVVVAYSYFASASSN